MRNAYSQQLTFLDFNAHLETGFFDFAQCCIFFFRHGEAVAHQFGFFDFFDYYRLCLDWQCRRRLLCANGRLERSRFTLATAGFATGLDFAAGVGFAATFGLTTAFDLAATAGSAFLTGTDFVMNNSFF